MKPSQKCVDLIKGAEGLRLEAYLCPGGRPTIGYGHTEGVKLGTQLTEEQAEELLRKDIEKTAALVSESLKVKVTQNQFDALVSFAFNCRGWGRSTLLQKVNAGDFEGALQEFPRWIHATDKNGKLIKLAGLIIRRAEEAALFKGCV